MEFLKGETDPVGDCGNFAAGIDVHGADQFPSDSRKRTWYSRVECYGSTAEHADELRDKVLGLLVTTEQNGELHKAVFMALESYRGADTFRDGVLALVQLASERQASLIAATKLLERCRSELDKHDGNAYCELGICEEGLIEEIDATLLVMAGHEDEAEPAYQFETGAYEVELGPERWAKVHAVFDRYKLTDEMGSGDMNGLVSEILIELGLARGDHL